MYGRGPNPARSTRHAILSVVHVRSPGIPDEPSDDEPTPPHLPVRPAHADESDPEAAHIEDPDPRIVRHPDGSIRFAVPTGVIAAKLGGAGVLAIVALLASIRSQLVIGLIAAAALAVYGLRDLLARERLRADPDGIVAVRGFAGHDRLAWADLEQVRVDSRQRLGSRTQLLEIDAGEHIYLFSRFDLGVDPDEAERAIATVRAG